MTLCVSDCLYCESANLNIISYDKPQLNTKSLASTSCVSEEESEVLRAEQSRLSVCDISGTKPLVEFLLSSLW